MNRKEIKEKIGESIVTARSVVNEKGDGEGEITMRVGKILEIRHNDDNEYQFKPPHFLEVLVNIFLENYVDRNLLRCTRLSDEGASLLADWTGQTKEFWEKIDLNYWKAAKESSMKTTDNLFKRQLYYAVKEVFEEHKLPMLGNVFSIKNQGNHKTNKVDAEIDIEKQELTFQVLLNDEQPEDILPSVVLKDSIEAQAESIFWKCFTHYVCTIKQIEPLPEEVWENDEITREMEKLLATWGINYTLTKCRASAGETRLEIRGTLNQNLRVFSRISSAKAGLKIVGILNAEENKDDNS